MSEYVDCRECNTECVRADGNYGYTFCSFFTHKKKTMTNADRIRAMSDEEMLQWITAGENCVMTICDHICGGECNAIATFEKSAVVACKEIVMKWLQQPAEEDDNEND